MSEEPDLDVNQDLNSNVDLGLTGISKMVECDLCGQDVTARGL